MSFFPVFTRELRSEMHSQRLRRERVSAALMAGLILGGLMIAEDWLGGFSIAKFARIVAAIPMSGVVPFVLFVIGLNRAGHLLSIERREGTLPLLFLTRLRGRDIVLGKLLQALFLELTYFLAIVPVLVLPVLALGFQWGEVWRIALGGLNVLFFALALGLLASVFGDGPKAVSWCLLLVLPFAAYSTPLGRFLPSGLRECLAALQWLNPCEALGHVQTVVGGFRSGVYWGPLLASHTAAWGFVVLAGVLLPRVNRWRSGIDAWTLSTKRGRSRSRASLNRSAVFRARLLNRNPFLWLTSRRRWATPRIWLMLAVPPLAWGWLAWLAWAGKGLNITIVLVVANAATWLAMLLILIPSESSKQLVEDRLSGALEMVLCTPFSAEEIIHGQWLALGRLYLVPGVLVMLLSATLMIAGYVTFGFGGMLDPEDRGLWLFWWLSGIILLPLSLVALGWISMRRALFARNTGEASGIAFIQAVFWPAIVLGVIFANGWPGIWAAILLFAAYGAFLMGFACRARSVLLADLREAAANRHSYSRASDTRALGRALRTWLRIQPMLVKQPKSSF